MKNKSQTGLRAIWHRVVEWWEKPAVSELSAVAIVFFTAVVVGLASYMGAGAPVSPAPIACEQVCNAAEAKDLLERYEARSLSTKIPDIAAYGTIAILVTLLWVVGVAPIASRERWVQRLLVIPAKLPLLPELAIGVALLFFTVARLLAHALSAIDWFLVKVVAYIAGATDESVAWRYATLAFWLTGAFTVATLGPYPWNLYAVGFAFVIIVSVSRRWQWMEDDRQSFSLSQKAKLFRLLKPEGFNQDLRDEALIALSFTFLFAVVGLDAVEREFHSFHYVGFIGSNDWLTFVGGELFKAAPFVDWSEVYGAENGSKIATYAESSKHAVFIMRVFFDLLLLAAIAQGVGLMGRISSLRRLFWEGSINKLDPFLERDEFRLQHTPEDLIKFPRYDEKRLDRIQILHPDAEMRWRASAFLMLQGHSEMVLNRTPDWERDDRDGDSDELEKRSVASETVRRATKRIKSERAAVKLAGFLRNTRNARARASAAYALGYIEAEDRIDELARSLSWDESLDVRKAAAWALGELEHMGGSEALIAALESQEMRSVAMRALADIGAATFTNDVARFLNDPSLTSDAAYSLRRIGGAEAFSLLKKATTSPEPEVRATALNMLVSASQLSMEEVVGFLKDTDSDVRSVALDALQYRVEPSRLLELVRSLLNDPSQDIRTEAALILAEHKDPASFDLVVPMLQNRDVRYRAIQKLAQLGDPRALGPLLKLLDEIDRESFELTTLIRALGEFADKRIVLPILAAYGRAGDDYMKFVCARSLAKVDRTSSVRMLVRLCYSRDDWVAGIAINRLMDLDQRRALSIGRALSRSSKAPARKTGVNFLGNYGSHRERRLLLRRMRDPDTEVRRAAVDAAFYILREGATKQLLRMAKSDPDEYVHIAALQHLADLKEPQALEPLLKAAASVDEEVQEVAAELLDIYNDERAKAALERLAQSKNWKIAAAAACALAKVGLATGFNRLSDLLHSERTCVRDRVANYLGATNRPEEAIPLLQRLVASDPAPRVRGAAQRMIEQFDRN